MKRRDFFAGAGTLAAATLVLSPTVAIAQAEAFKEGADYARLAKPAATEAPAGKVEVVEFFGYWCPHCNAFEPTLSAWLKRLPKEITFRRVPVAFRSEEAPLQQLYFALEAMGLVDKLQSKVFGAIHAEKQNLSTPDAITNWVVKQGVDKATFLAQFNSFSMSNKLARARQLMTAYQVEGVPALGVAGRFYTDGSLAKGMDRALHVVEFLAAEVRAGR